MTLFFTMLPLYLFGNLHCFGMCGPLVMMLGRHKYRYFYFAGRIFSFSLAGMVAGGAGEVLNLILRRYQISALTSVIFGGIICIVGFYSLSGRPYPGQKWLAGRLSNTNRSLSLLMLKDQPLTTFLFGFFTIALPCGQTLIVFAACALAGDPIVGLFNGFAFALLTSPALLFAMQAHRVLGSLKPYYNTIMGGLALCVGILAIFRGLAEMELMDHWILNPNSSQEYHIVLW